MLFQSLCALLLVAAPPKPFLTGPSVEGVTEYALPNGLKVLLLPDPSASNVTVDLTVLVGSRHEGYGEKGMAHLLEHLLFKGSPAYKDPKKLLDARGAQWNGMTFEDRTTYFESMPANELNLEFGLRFEADRLVNSFVSKKDLDTEMTVVRNEFEASENDSGGVLRGRVRALAMPWHNYGRAVIGVRADIERVPIEHLQAFYRRYYQPDNAVLIVSGKFNEAKVFSLVADSFGRLPRPARRLTDTFTTEPTQDGERWVSVRRAGGAPSLFAVWRIPAMSDPDYPALMVLQGVLGDEPQGRLHQALVDAKKAASARCDLDELKEPGLFSCAASFKEGDSTQPAREAMLGLVESPKAPGDDEVARSRDGWLSQYEQELAHTDALAFRLSSSAAMGDWRLSYLLRDRLKAVTTADVGRVWARYLRPQNRSMGEYVPTASPDRVEVPEAADAKTVLAGYTGGKAVEQGEAFDPTPKNIDARTRRVTLQSGAQLLLLPKKTRAQTVSLVVELRLGTASSLTGKQAVASLTAGLLNRGTAKHGYRDYRSMLERLKSVITIHGRGQEVTVFVQTKRPQLEAVLALLGEVLKDVALDPAELEVLKSELITHLDEAKSEPGMVGPNELARAVSPLPVDHVLATLPIVEQLAAVRAVTAVQVKSFWRRFYGAQNASVAVVGDFDTVDVEGKLRELFGAWIASERYERIVEPFVATVPSAQVVLIADKANAWLGAGAMVRMTDSSPDYPAFLLASAALGGSPSARLFTNLREKRGLSYGAYAMFQADPRSERALLTTSVIYAPQNESAAEAGLREELSRWPSLTPEEVDHVKGELLESRAQARGSDDELAFSLAALSQHGRTMEWEAGLDRAIKAVTAGQANAAVQKYVDPAKVVLVKAGDFKTVGAPK